MKITNLVRSVPISSASTTTSVLTINTTVAHNMVTGDMLALDVNVKPVHTVTVVDSDTLTIPAVYNSTSNLPFVPTGVIYPLGLKSGALTTLSYPLGSNSDSISTFQVVGITSAGSGAATVNIEVSNNNVNWLLYGTITLTLGTTSTSDGLVIAAPWGYVRGNATSITGTNGKVNILMGRSA